MDSINFSYGGANHTVGSLSDMASPTRHYVSTRKKGVSHRGDVWSDERTDLLKKLWTDGLSASQIAGELGGITRNAVIGKVHRLGLSGRAKSPSSAPRVRKPRTHMMRARAQTTVRGNTALALAFEMEQEPEPELIENIIPVGQRRTLLELSADTCRWPIGDPASAEFFFCGGKPLPGYIGEGTGSKIPYCSYHCRVAYQPAADRRRAA